MDLFFVNDEPRVLYASPKYTRALKNVQPFTHDGCTFWSAESTHVNALQRLKDLSAMYTKSVINASFKAALYAYLGTIIDADRGDGFTLLMIPFEDWITVL
jgi:hypothetical protein